MPLILKMLRLLAAYTKQEFIQLQTALVRSKTTPRTLSRVFNKIYGIGFLKQFILDVIINITIHKIKTQFPKIFNTKIDPPNIIIQLVFT